MITTLFLPKNFSGGSWRIYQDFSPLTKLKEPLPATGSVQVPHSRENHWIVASLLGALLVKWMFLPPCTNLWTQQLLTCSNISLDVTSRSRWRDVPSKLAVETVDYLQLPTVQPLHMVAILAMLAMQPRVLCDSTCWTALSHFTPFPNSIWINTHHHNIILLVFVCIATTTCSCVYNHVILSVNLKDKFHWMWYIYNNCGGSRQILQVLTVVVSTGISSPLQLQ